MQASAQKNLGTVLFVDDEEFILNLMQDFLADAPFEVLTSRNPLTALKLINDVSIDMVISDYNMPEMDGLSCLRIMMDQNPKCMVLIISALNDVETGLKALKLGARGYINKPFRNGELLREISRMGNLP